MTCDELRPDYLLYALGSLEDPELSEIRAHLRRECEDCTKGVREACGLASALGAGLEGPEPPKRLRNRVLEGVGGRPEKRFSLINAWTAAAATAALMIAVGIGIYSYEQRGFREQLAQVQAVAQRSSSDAAFMRQAIELLQAPETRAVGFGEGQPTPPRGKVFFQRAGVLLLASHLPPPPPGKTYEMWVIRAGKPTPAALFASDAQGTAIHIYRPVTPPETSDVIAVTLEPAGGVPLPTSTPVIAAPL